MDIHYDGHISQGYSFATGLRFGLVGISQADVAHAAACNVPGGGGQPRRLNFLIILLVELEAQPFSLSFAICMSSIHLP